MILIYGKKGHAIFPPVPRGKLRPGEEGVGIELGRAFPYVEGYHSRPFGCEVGSHFHHRPRLPKPPVSSRTKNKGVFILDNLVSRPSRETAGRPSRETAGRPTRRTAGRSANILF